jgi:CspA family cold shock protein
MTTGTGVIKRFDGEKGYGFILPDCGGGDLFFHIKSCEREDIAKGDRVKFDERPSSRHPGKFEAAAVVLIQRGE